MKRTHRPSFVAAALLFGAASAPLAQAAGPPEPEQAEAPRGLHARTEDAFDGLTLLAPLRSTETFLLDMNGEIVHRWRSDYSPGNTVELLENGNLLRAGRVPHPLMGGGGQGGRLQEFTWEGALVWDFASSDKERLAHHDFEVLPNGNLLVISWEHRSAKEALAFGRDADQVGTDGFWPDVVYEIERVYPDEAKVVWEWHAFDHLVQDRDPQRPGFGTIVDRPERIDINGDHRSDAPLSTAEQDRREEQARQMQALGYTGEDSGPGEAEGNADFMHANAVDYHPEHDLILLSARTFSEIWVIDHSTTVEEARESSGGRYGHGGDLLFRWGNPKTYGMGTGESQRLFAQHDAQWIPDGLPGAGHILVFNNGDGRGYSSVDEIAPLFDPKSGFYRDSGQPFEPNEPLWSYAAEPRDSFYSGFISGAQRLPNGNTLICSGAEGRVFEVTAAGEVVWDYFNEHTGDEPLIVARGPFGKGPPDRKPGGAGLGEPGTPDGPGGEMAPMGLFRATRIPHDHPGLAALRETARGDR